MKLDHDFDEIEKEVKLLKNEIKQILLDIREQLLTNYQNPFSMPAVAPASAKLETTETKETAAVPETPAALHGGQGQSEAAMLDNSPQEQGKFNNMPGGFDEVANPSMRTETVFRHEPVAPEESWATHTRGGAESGFNERGIDQRNQMGMRQTGMGQMGMAQGMPGMQSGFGGPADQLSTTIGMTMSTPDMLRNEQESFSKNAFLSDLQKTLMGNQQNTKSSNPTGGIDMAIVASLAQWTGSSIQRVGKERLGVLLEVYEMTGHLNGIYKELLQKLIEGSVDQGPRGSVDMNDVLPILTQLDGIFGGGSGSTNTQANSAATLLSSLLR